MRGLGVFDLNRSVSPLVAGGWLEPLEAGPECKAWAVNPYVKTLFEDKEREERRRKEILKATMAKSFAKRRAEGHHEKPD
jgi:hypothetical protein